MGKFGKKVENFGFSSFGKTFKKMSPRVVHFSNHRKKAEDRKEERDIELRKPNIIIHGIVEPMKETIEKD